MLLSLYLKLLKLLYYMIVPCYVLGGWLSFFFKLITDKLICICSTICKIFCTSQSFCSTISSVVFFRFFRSYVPDSFLRSWSLYACDSVVTEVTKVAYRFFFSLNIVLCWQTYFILLVVAWRNVVATWRLSKSMKTSQLTLFKVKLIETIYHGYPLFWVLRLHYEFMLLHWLMNLSSDLMRLYFFWCSWLMPLQLFDMLTRLMWLH